MSSVKNLAHIYHFHLRNVHPRHYLLTKNNFDYAKSSFTHVINYDSAMSLIKLFFKRTKVKNMSTNFEKRLIVYVIR